MKVHYELASPKYGAYFLARDGEHLKRVSSRWLLLFKCILQTSVIALSPVLQLQQERFS